MCQNKNIPIKTSVKINTYPQLALLDDGILSVNHELSYSMQNPDALEIYVRFSGDFQTWKEINKEDRSGRKI